MKPRHSILARPAFALALLTLVTDSPAATRFKEDNSDALNLPSSWDILPGPADIAQWDYAVTAANSPVLGADLSWAGIKIIDPGGLVTIAGTNTLTIGASGIDLSTATQNLTIACGLKLEGKQNWSAAAGTTLDVTGTFNRTGAVVGFTNFNAAATLGTLANVNGILGPWATTGSTTALKYVTNSGGAVAAYTGATAAAANLADVTSATDNFSYSAGATPTGSLTCNTLQYTGAANTTALGTNGLTLNGLMNAGTGKLTITGTAANPGLVIGSSGELVIISNNQPIDINSVISGTGTVVLNSASTITLGVTNFTNTYVGSTVINGGSVSFLAAASPAAFFGTGPVTVNPGATLALNRTTLSNAFTFNGVTVTAGNSFTSVLSGPITLGATTTVNVTGNLTISGEISGAGGLTKLGGATVPVTGANNTYTGPTTINAGALTFKSSLYGNDDTKWTPANITVASGAALILNVGGTGEFTVEQFSTLFNQLTTGVDNNGLKAGSVIGLDTNNAGAATVHTIAATLADSTGPGGGGAVGIKHFGVGTLELTGPNTYSGVTITDRNGTLKVSSLNSVFDDPVLGTVHSASSNLGAPTTVANGTIKLGQSTFQGGNLTYTGAGETTDRVLNLGGANNTTYRLDQSGDGLLKFINPFTITDNRGPKTIVLQGSTAGTGEIAGVIPLGQSTTQPNHLTKSGTGTWTLSAANANAGGVFTVTGGALVLANATAIPGGIGAAGGLSALTFNGGVIGLGAGDFTRNLAAAGTVTGVTFTGNGGWAAYGADRAVNLGGASATVAWATAGTGLNGKTLILGNATATHTVDFQNPLDLGAATRTVQVDDGAAAIDGKLSGSLTNGTLTKTGPGTLALTGSNSYDGATTVGAGTLLVNGTNSGTGTVTVNPGATLGGTGSMAGGAYFENGATAVFTVTRDPVTQANLTPLTIAGEIDVYDTEIHLNVPDNLPSGVYTLATSSVPLPGTASVIATPVLDSGSYAPGVTSAVVSVDTVNNKLLLTVNGLPTNPTKLAITSVNGGVSPFAGVGFDVVVQAQDANGATRQVLADTAVSLSLNTGSGPLGGTLTGIIPAGGVSVTISGVTCGTAESGVVLTATRTGGDSLTAGNSAPFTVLPATTPAYLTVTGFPSPQTAGSPGSVTVTCKTASGTTATSYTGTVHFTSTAVAAGLPADYTFVSGDNGEHVFTGVTLNTAGIQSITATDTVTPSITGTQSDITVTPAAASVLIVAGYPSPRPAGVADSVTVTAKDAYGNTAPAYTGTIQFTSSDGAAALPANYTFTGGDAGVHVFSGVTLNTLGVQSITATDTVTPAITGTQSAITVWVPPTSFTWRTATNGNWGDATKWAQSSGLDYAPITTGQADYALNFIAGTYTATHNLTDGFLVNQLNFAGAVTLEGTNGLALTGTLPTVNQNSTSGVVINPPVSLAADVTVAGSGTGQVDLAGLLSGTGSLTKSNPGVLKIYGLVPNTYGGGTVISTGTLHLGTIVAGISPPCTGVLGTGPVTLGLGTTIEFDRVTADNSLTSNGGTLYSQNGWGATWSGPITLNADTTLKADYTLTCSGEISGTGGLTKTNGGPAILSGTNSYTGPTSVTAGTLQCNLPDALGGGDLSISGTGKLNLNFTGTKSVTSLTLGGIPQTTSGTYGSTASDAANKNDTWFAGTGTVTLGGGSDYDSWLGGFTFAPGADTTPTGDPDGDGATNQEEYSFGLNPTLGSSVNPITIPLTTGGMFTYTRRNPSLTGLLYTVWTSPDLVTWTKDATAGQLPDSPGAAVQTVSVTLTPPVPEVGGKLFVRVVAAPPP